MEFNWMFVFVIVFVVSPIILFLADMIICHVQDFFRSIKSKRTKSYSHANISES